VDLSDPTNSTRQIWTLSEGAGGPGGPQASESLGEWNRVDMWP